MEFIHAFSFICCLLCCFHAEQQNRVACKAKTIYYLTLYRKKKVYWWYSESALHFLTYAQILLKCRMGLRRPRPRFSISNVLPHEANASDLQVPSCFSVFALVTVPDYSAPKALCLYKFLLGSPNLNPATSVTSPNYSNWLWYLLPHCTYFASLLWLFNVMFALTFFFF